MLPRDGTQMHYFNALTWLGVLFRTYKLWMIKCSQKHAQSSNQDGWMDKTHFLKYYLLYSTEIKSYSFETTIG